MRFSPSLINSFLVFIFSFLFTAKAQIYPDKVILNHTQIMFEYPQVKNVDAYKIQITSANSSYEKPAYTGIDSTTAHLAGILQFNTNYKWRYIAFDNGQIIFTSPDYFFQTAKTGITKMFKPNVTAYDSTKYLSGLIFLDQGLVIDRKGNLVLISDSFGLEKRDFSLTPSGSITYVQGAQAFDRTLNSNMIWKSATLQKENTTISGYHHDITKLQNGRYLIMCKVKEKDSTRFRKHLNEGIVEVDQQNKIHWLWKEHEHISDSSKIKVTHSNSIFLDEIKNTIYVSSRDINTIFTIDRADGKIKKCIGRKLANDAEHFNPGSFYGQHSAQLVANGNILLFNNNARPPKPGLPSMIMEITNPLKPNDEAAPKFFYIYDFDRSENHCAKGGDVNKLKNENYLVSSSANNRNFEINGSSEMLWECRPMKLDTITGVQTQLGSYRINYEPNLYPSFFTLEWNYISDAVSGYKITNKGFNDDNYTIVLKNKKGKVISKSERSINAGNKIMINFTPGEKINSVSVYSATQPSRVKELKVSINSSKK